ncbi:hypothetical protein V2S66_00070 [Streptomyces sp. V4-01]|uniref:SH3 domain-containing protein n=1 Tax=Actinacidiphila polyblastidii TaxID=3110430 RepID=A0ABU7P3J1_9ACTN|nr:hypothetical protein [Streptomyces sp. V4-01]
MGDTTMERRTARIATFSASAVLAAASLISVAPSALAAAPSAAAASTCDQTGTNKDGGSGTVTSSALARRPGPYTTCSPLGQADHNALIYYWCYKVGGYTPDGLYDTWTYGRISGTSQQGWFSDEYLSNHGATHLC